jgi:hypothetical protein
MLAGAQNAGALIREIVTEEGPRTLPSLALLNPQKAAIPETAEVRRCSSLTLGEGAGPAFTKLFYGLLGSICSNE